MSKHKRNLYQCKTADEYGHWAEKQSDEAHYCKNGGRHPQVRYRGYSVAVGHPTGELPIGTRHSIVRAFLAIGLAAVVLYVILPYLTA